MRVLAVTGPSGAGATTLIEELIGRLDGRVATVTHREDTSDIDTGGADTAGHRRAGAAATWRIARA